MSVMFQAAGKDAATGRVFLSLRKAVVCRECAVTAASHMMEINLALDAAAVAYNVVVAVAAAAPGVEYGGLADLFLLRSSQK